MDPQAVVVIPPFSRTELQHDFILHARRQQALLVITHRLKKSCWYLLTVDIVHALEVTVAAAGNPENATCSRRVKYAAQTLKYGVLGSKTCRPVVLGEVLHKRTRCSCTLPTVKPPKCTTAGRASTQASLPIAAYTSAGRTVCAGNHSRCQLCSVSMLTYYPAGRCSLQASNALQSRRPPALRATMPSCVSPGKQ